jgi:calcineurin-like phosphoesterase family protein
MRINIEHQNIWFTSDYHFCHANVIKYDNRPFSDVEEMNECLIETWNHYIHKDDIVFYLGDLSFDKSGKRTKEIVDSLNGKIHYIMGNHDKEKDIKKLNRFETISDYVNLSVPDLDNPRKRQGIMMMHYPILSWDKAHHGDWHLHGHCHQSLVDKMPEYYKRKVLDMGCNGWDYAPAHYTDIKEAMMKKEVASVDHHE